jgi:hypothetical protein
MEGLLGLFEPEKVLRQSLRRGEVPAPTTQIAT